MGIKWTNSNKIVPLSKKNVCCQTAEMRENSKKILCKNYGAKIELTQKEWNIV